MLRRDSPADERPAMEFLGHAGLLFRYRGTTVLCDPWLSSDGAFLHSWRQYPPNDFLAIEPLHRADYLYISHDHADHFDRSFLAGFPKDHVTVVIADFLSDRLARALAKLGFPSIVRLADWQPLRVADNLQLTIIQDQSGFKMDSALLIEAGGYRFLDRNDCHLAVEDRDRLRKLGIDLFLSQFSGAMWYPAAYDYPPARTREIAAEVRAGLLAKFVARANHIGARHLIHAAGPPCFLDDEFVSQNDSANGIFHDQLEVMPLLQPRLTGRLHLVAPGDRLEPTSDGDLRIERVRPFDFSRRQSVISDYRKRLLPETKVYLAGLPAPEPGFMKRFKRYVGKLFGSSKLLRERSNALVHFAVHGPNGGEFFIDLRKGRFTVTERCKESPTYEFFLDGPIARLLADGVEHWEDVLLSMRFRVRRDPDDYNWPLFALLRYGHDARLIGRIEETMTRSCSATTQVREAGTSYTIQRYCPHSGEDLAGVPVTNGKLVCPRHRWTFDLERDGACLRGGNIPLRVYDIQEDEEQEGEV
ncbi:MAG: Rieske 2Fe-2S domain-containing protein [Actinomycetota bacterium]